MNYIDKKYKKLIEDIRSIFQKSKQKVFEVRNTIKVIDFEGESLVIKSYKIPHLLNRFVYKYFRDSKAKKSYYNSLRLQELGINISKPIGYANFGKYLLEDSYFISEKIDFDFHIKEVIQNKTLENRDSIFKQFAHFVRDLHDKGVFHQDFSAGNILIKVEDENYKFYIVDINRMKFKTLSLEEKMKNFAKLWISDEDLSIIIKEYARIENGNYDKYFSLAQKFSQKHKDKINTKKRLRGQEVVD